MIGMVKPRIYLLLLFFCSMLTGCSTIKPDTDVFRIDILQGDVTSLKLGYEYSEACKIIQANEEQILLTIEEGDIESYDWQNQVIALTETGSLKLEPYLSDILIVKNAFVVRLGEQKQYGGVVIEEGSAMAIRYPVIYISTENATNYKLIIRPIHGILHQSIGLEDYALADRQIIELTAIYNRLKKAGKLTEN